LYCDNIYDNDNEYIGKIGSKKTITSSITLTNNTAYQNTTGTAVNLRVTFSTTSIADVAIQTSSNGTSNWQAVDRRGGLPNNSQQTLQGIIFAGWYYRVVLNSGTTNSIFGVLIY
jgi:hypothetical protein